MHRTARFLLALAVALVLMLCFRAVAFTLYTVEGEGLAPLFMRGDRVLVNRWSYGLRLGGDDSFFGYTRIGRQQVERGDIVAFDNPLADGEVLICRCQALPGDTVVSDGQTLVVPGINSCDTRDYYWMQAIGTGNAIDSRTLGVVSEELIIGRVTTIVYSHDPTKTPWSGWRGNRTMLPL